MAKFQNAGKSISGNTNMIPNFTIAIKERLWRCNTCNQFMSAKKVYDTPSIPVGLICTHSCYHCNEPLWSLKC